MARENTADRRTARGSRMIPGGGRIVPGAASILMGLLAVSAGCDADFTGLEDVLNASPTYVNLPGYRVAEGSFRRATIDGTKADGAYVVAFDVETTTRVAVIPLEGGPGCRTEPASVFQSFLVSPTTELDFFIPYVEPATEARPSRQHLARPDCSEPLAPIENVKEVESPPGSDHDPVGFATLTVGGHLYFVDPWRRKRTLVAERVLDVNLSAQRIWTLEQSSDPQSGQEETSVVARDYEFKEQARYGHAVREFTLTSRAQPRLAYVETDPEAKDAEGGIIYVVDEDPEEAEKPERVDDAACRVRFVSSWNGLGMSYLKPCADNRLVLHRTLKQAGSGYAKADETYVLGEGARAATLQQVADRTMVFFQMGEDVDGYSDLYGGVLGDTYEKIGALARADSVGTPIRGKWRVRVDVQGRAGRLVEWSPGSAPAELARGVTRLDGSLAIVDYDGVAGDAVYIAADGGRRVLARRVPYNGLIRDIMGSAILRDYDGKRGTLIASSSEGFDYETIAEGVPGNGFGFVLNLDAVGYLHDFDPDTGMGTLAVRVLSTADTFDIGVRASEWREMFWPRPGLLYTVPDGPNRGVWFARIM